eukprot:CAMPEP_0172478272 /NCGR_PEP_ID=MMETSP1066-20121228/2115_1 /TAXON_ID=671091 /ORGANISM="Coscinodiscus wailesii, Strain CCMP2513" /LENGTH=59 /DNA_ID=CAMNT_0013237691 /DNA_START=25 /DNA_END=201 /DNA_ORIENTATION=-
MTMKECQWYRDPITGVLEPDFVRDVTVNPDNMIHLMDRHDVPIVTPNGKPRVMVDPGGL